MCHCCFYYSISMPCWRYLGPFWHIWVNQSKQKRRQPSNRRKHQKTTIWDVLSNLSIHLLAIGFRKLPSSFSKSFSLCATRRRSKAGHAPGDTSSNIAMMVSRDGWPCVMQIGSGWNGCFQLVHCVNFLTTIFEEGSESYSTCFVFVFLFCLFFLWDVCENRWSIHWHTTGCPCAPVCHALKGWCDWEAMRHLIFSDISKHVGLWTLRRTHHSASMANKGNGGQILDESSVLGASERWAHCPCQAHAAAYLAPLAYQKPRRNWQLWYDFCNPILTRQLVPFQKIEYVLTKSKSRPSHVCDCTSKLRPFNPCESDYVKVKQCKTISAQFTMHVLMQHIEIWWNLNILCKPVPLPSGCGPQRVSAMMLQNSSG